MKRLLTIIVFVAAFIAGAWAADTAASFPGGKKAQDEFIAKNLVYPEMARENGVEGVVTVSFTVKADGSVGNIKIKRMIDPDLEAEAIRIVKKMPAWTPATKDGKAVDSTVDIPFTFRLGM